MKERVVWILTLLTGLTIWGCGNADSDFETDTGTGDDGECEEGDTRCQKDTVQMCEDGHWVDWSHCAAFDMICAIVHGESQCVDGGGDMDTDTDTRSVSLYVPAL